MSKSRAHGALVNISINTDGIVTQTNEANSFSFRCDKSEFQNAAGHTTVCDPLSSSQWSFTVWSNGRISLRYTWTVSSDGKVFTIRAREVSPDGTKAINEKTYIRQSGATSFIGKWQEAFPLESRAHILEIRMNGRRLHLGYPDLGLYSDSLIDGSPVPISGPRSRPSVTTSIKQIAPDQLKIQTLFSGFVVREGTLETNENSRILTWQSWPFGSPELKDKLVYDKQ